MVEKGEIEMVDSVLLGISPEDIELDMGPFGVNSIKACLIRSIAGRSSGYPEDFLGRFSVGDLLAFSRRLRQKD